MDEAVIFLVRVNLSEGKTHLCNSFENITENMR